MMRVHVFNLSEFSSLQARRWVTFNAVGLMGVGVQTLTLMTVCSLTGMRYPLATALAVETAVLHNFCWHQCWTWSDRPAGNLNETLARLVRFNLSTGAVSMAGNLLSMGLLVKGLHMHYLAANLMAIAACSVLSFLVSERFAFKEVTQLYPFLGRRRHPPSKSCSTRRISQHV